MRHHGDKSVEVWYWQTAEVKPHETVTHTEHVISYHVEGHLSMEHGQVLAVGPGTLTILPSGVPHRSLGGKDVGLWLVHFCATCLHLDETHPIMGLFRHIRHGALPLVPLPPERHEYIVGLFEALQREAADTTPETEVVIHSLLMLLLAEVNRAARNLPGEIHEPKGSLVGDALAYIQAHCLTPISPRDVAAAVNRNPAHVTAVLKKKTGFSTGQWITAGRLSEATRRLAHTDDSIEQIAEQVGWSDVTHFIRQFRKHHGTTPAAWRIQSRQNPDPQQDTRCK